MQILMDHATLAMILAIWFISFHFIKLLFSQQTTKLLPPGPKPLPIIGNILEVGKKPHRSFANLAKIHGPLISLRLGSVTTIVVSSADVAKEMFLKKDHPLSNRTIPNSVTAGDHHKLTMSWLPVSPKWRNFRKITAVHLLSPQRLDACQTFRHAKVQQLYEYVQECAQKGQAVDIGKAAFTTSLNLLSKLFFSVELAHHKSHTSQEFKELIWNIMEDIGKPNYADYFPILGCVDPSGIRRRLACSFDKLIAVFQGIICERLAPDSSTTTTTTTDDVLDVLLQLFKQNELTMGEINHLLVDIFDAGTDTTSSTFEWVMTELIRNPEMMEKAQEEIKQVLGKDKQIQESDIINLPYLQAIIKETLRLHPPTVFLLPRKADTDVELYGYIVPKDAQILVNLWAIGRDPNAWQNADIFSPERFIGCEIDVKGRDFGLLPFGAGRRICPGMNLAIRMLTLMLATLLQFFNWKLEGDISPKDLDMDEKFGIALQKTKPLKLIPIPRYGSGATNFSLLKQAGDVEENPGPMKMMNGEDANDQMIKESFFITHGNPILTVEDTHPLRPFFETWREKIFSKKPKAILIISGHWETVKPTVNAVHINDTIHDFDDYPAAMYQFKYPAPGEPELARKVEEILKKSGFETAETDQKRGLDHGAWVPLMLMYPEADIPVCQLSVQPHLDGTYHYNLGRALAPLKNDGVLIIGSGSATHPLDETPHYFDGVAPWAAAFDSWLRKALINGRFEEVNIYESKAPNWKLAHPFPEHFYPLHVVLGAAGEKWKAELIHSSWDHGTLCHGSYKFTSAGSGATNFSLLKQAGDVEENPGPMTAIKMNTNGEGETQHILMIPFMAQGHLRPFLELAMFLYKRSHVIITLLTTPLNAGFLRHLLHHHSYSSSGIRIVELPFNSTNHGLPPGIENTDKLTLPLVVSLFHSTISLDPHLRDYISRHFSPARPPLCVIHDVFLGWVDQVAKDVGSTGVVFTTGGAYGTSAYVSIWNDLPHQNYSDDQEFPLPGFPENHKFRRSQLHRFLRYADGSDDWSKYFQPQLRQSMKSFGWLCNSVEEIETLGFSILRNYTKLPIWGIGPLIASPVQHSSSDNNSTGAEFVQWLSLKEPDSVLYISFGSQNTISPTQMMELAAGLESSEKPFLWVIRAPFGFDINEEMRPEWLPEGFEERMKVKKQGKLVYKLGPQLEILNHESIGGFLTHCGWNSILESLREGVPMLGWPLAAEQAYNLKYLEDEMGVAVELARGLEGEISKEKVKRIVEMILERNEGSKGWEMKNRAVEMGKKLKDAVNEEKELKGSSVKAIDDFLDAVMQAKLEPSLQ